MALVSYIQTPEGFDDSYYKNLKLTSKFLFPRVTKNTRFLSRKKKLDLKNRSLFGLFSDYWKTLDSTEKAAWSAAADEIGLNNWQLFIHDTAARHKYDYEGFSVPNLLHQGYVGHIHIDSISEGSVFGKTCFGLSNYGDAVVSSNDVKIAQLHPKFYWVQRLISGHKRSWEPVKITEDFSLPLKIELNYSSDLVSVESGSFAKFYASVWHSYQGVDYHTEHKIDLDLQTDWKNESNFLESLIGQIIHYDLYIELHGLTGDLYFDNVKAEHSGQNWVRDSRCDDISKTLPRIWFLIPQRWVGVDVPDIAFFESKYKDFS
jgi:hypothetical protein